ncbi:MAG: site-specific integrase [Prevotella sp.]|jgi:site-specific recombinase XerD|nr:site-specific integrase [Prevotella sp.]
MKPTDFSKYLTQYLPVECGVSQNTVQAYSQTFMIFLKYMSEEECIKAENLTLQDITKQRVTGFLDWLEKERRCGVSTRNARLATLHSFFRFIQYRDLNGLIRWQEILSVRFKKSYSPEMAYLTVEGLKLLLKQPDITARYGRRDLALLGLLYDSGARVQELINITPADLRFDEIATVRLQGKGRKVRIVPLSSTQVQNLKRYMTENGLFESQNAAHPIFTNPQNNRLSRVAVLNIVKKYAETARKSSPDLIPDKISCHTFRHSKAMHMLEADINLIYIRDFLGHVSTTTTEVYARASSKKKADALQKLNPSIVPNEKTSWHKDGQLVP